MKSYTTLFFDLDGTLLDYEKSEAWGLERALREAGLSLFSTEIADLYSVINKEYWHRFEQGDISLSDLRVGRFRDLIRHLDIVADPQILSERYLDFFGIKGFIIDGSLDILEKLDDQFKLLALSNGISRVQKTRMADSGMDQYFPVVITSEGAGVQKPDPEIFRIAMEACGVKNPEEILMIGDSLASDIGGAANAGIDSCFFSPEGIDPAPYTPTYTIQELSELETILQIP